MTTVQNHIKELLFEQECVVIPEFGGFVTNFDCAKMDSANRYIKPPQKWLAFNSLLKNDDGLLSNYIAREEQITREQASLKIKSFVEDTKKSLNAINSYQIEGLGIFSQNEENKLQFQPLTTNFYSESFGLENIFLKKTISSQQELQVVQKTVVSDITVQQVFAAQDREPTVEIWEGEEETTTFRRNRFSRVLPYVYGVVGTLILVSAIYMYDNSKANLSSLNPFKSNHQMEPVAKIKEEITPTLPAKIESKPFVNESPIASITPSETINISEKRFFIITGSFGSKQNAKSLLNKLKARGFEDASIIYPSRNEKLIKVSAGGFSDEAQADQVALKVSESINQNTWIYKK